MIFPGPGEPDGTWEAIEHFMAMRAWQRWAPHACGRYRRIFQDKVLKVWNRQAPKKIISITGISLKGAASKDIKAERWKKGQHRWRVCHRKEANKKKIKE
jgi:hypothetical protein